MAAAKKPDEAAQAEAPPNYPEPTGLNIHQRILRVMADVERVTKRGESTFGERFKYARHDDVMAALRGPMVTHGLALQVLPDIANCSRSEHGATKSGTMQYRWLVVATFRLVNADDPADFLEATYIGEGIDTGDKAVGKALSYATKNYLLKEFLLPSGDDADNEASDTAAAKPAAAKPPDDPHARALRAMYAGATSSGLKKPDVVAYFARQLPGLKSTKDASTEQLQAARSVFLAYPAHAKVFGEACEAADIDPVAFWSATFPDVPQAALSSEEWSAAINAVKAPPDDIDFDETAALEDPNDPRLKDPRADTNDQAKESE